jgi:hypothetical protein
MDEELTRLTRRIDRLEARLKILLAGLRKTEIERLGMIEDAAQMERTIKPRKQRRQKPQ